MNAFLWWLCQNSIVVAFMIPFVWLLCRAFRARPAVQHVFWLVLLVKLLLPPITDVPLSFEVPFSSYQPSMVDTSPPLPPLLPRAPVLERIVAAPDIVAAPTDLALPPEPLLTMTLFVQALIVLWAIGCGIACLLQLRRIGRYRALIRGGTVAPSHLDEEIACVARQMGLRPLRAVVVQGIATPFVWCLGRLCLIWPEALVAESDVHRSRGMIAHELAHVRRRDHWVAWLEFVAGLAWWWNPLFWFVRRRLRESAELACDALAIAALPDERRAYAEMFLELSSRFQPGASVPVLGISTGAPSSFEKRLTMILSEHVSGKLSWRGIFLAVTLAGALAPTWSLGQSGSASGGRTTTTQQSTNKAIEPSQATTENATASEKSLKQAFLDGERKIAFSMDNKPWSQVIDWIVDQTGLVYISAQAAPTGTFKFISPKGATYTFPDVIDIVNEGLQQHQHALIRRAASFSVVSADAALASTLVPRVNIDDLHRRGKTEIVQILVPLKVMNAEEFAADIKKQLGPFGQVTPLTSSNQLLIHDSASNLRRVLTTIDGLEKHDEVETLSHKCVYVKASQAELFLKDIFGIPREDLQRGAANLFVEGKQAGKAAPRQRNAGLVNIRSDDRTNTVFVNAQPNRIAQAKSYLKNYDQPQFGGQQPLLLSDTNTVYRVLKLTNVQAKEIAKTLTELFAQGGGKDLTIVGEPMTNSLLIRGSGEQQEVVLAIVEQLEVAARERPAASPARPDGKTSPDKGASKKADTSKN